jgi:F-type H+-transporting ATPase subunit b
VSPAVANFLFEAGNFLLLAGGLGWLLFRPVRRALDNERARHAKLEEDAARLRSESEALTKEAHGARDAAEREAEQRRLEARAAAQKEVDRILEEARGVEARDRQRFDRELESTRRTQTAALAEAVGRVAGESVHRLLETLQGPALDLALVRAACRELGGLAETVRASALVESARPLDPESRRLLEEVLGQAFQHRLMPDLGAGVRVTTPQGQVDASALSIGREAARRIAAAVSPGGNGSQGNG